MKQLFTFIYILFLAPVALVHAQCEIDESYTEPGIYPENLPAVCVNTEFNEVLQFVIPKEEFGTEVDSAKITSVDGLPENFEYTCHNADCMIINPKDGTNPQGCVNVVGTPENDGTINLTFNVTLYYNEGTTFATTYTSDIEVLSSDHQDCVVNSAKSSDSTEPVSVFPNPVNSENTVHFSEELTNIEVYDVLGNMVLEQSKGKTINTNKMNKGIYIISSDEGKFRLVVE